METFYKALESVFNITPEMAKTLVRNFNTGDLAFFETYFKALPTVKLDTGNSKKFFENYFNASPTVKLETGNTKNISANETLFIEEESIGSGGYGIIFKNRARPYLYKMVIDHARVDDKNTLLYFKTNFKEAIIQTLLQCDVTYGKYVCRLYKVYRSGNDFVFQIEPLEITLEKYLYLNRLEEHLPETAGKILLKLIEIVNYFNANYGFNHNDFSSTNIMTLKEGNIVENIKLIDFGRSSVNFADVQLGSLKTKRDDLNNLFISTMKYKLEEKDRKLFSKIIKLPSETPMKTFTNILSSKKKNKKGGKRITIRRQPLKLSATLHKRHLIDYK